MKMHFSDRHPQIFVQKIMSAKNFNFSINFPKMEISGNPVSIFYYC